MITDGMSIVQSYNFWNWWFANHEALAAKLEGYKWPQPLLIFNQMLHGRTCPSCHGDQYFHLRQPVRIGSFMISKGYCFCLLLQEMENEFTYKSDYRKEMLKDVVEYGPHAAVTKFIKKEAQSFIQYPSMWYYLYGGFGSGKTKILSAIKTQLRGLALYITASDLNGYVFKATGERNLDLLIDELSSVPILLLDDLGTEYSSPYLYSAMYSIINKRYIKGIDFPLFVTSNLTQNQLMTSSEENMKRIGTRLSDVDLVIPLVSKQEDYRRRKI